MTTTGDTCSQTGTYVGTCRKGHAAKKRFEEGERFTGCPKCKPDERKGETDMHWVLVAS